MDGREKLVNKTIRLTEPTYQKMMQICQAQGIKQYHFVEKAMTLLIEKIEAEGITVLFEE